MTHPRRKPLSNKKNEETITVLAADRAPRPGMYEKTSESKAPAALASVSSFNVSEDISPPVGSAGNGAAGSEKNGPDRRRWL